MSETSTEGMPESGATPTAEGTESGGEPKQETAAEKRWRLAINQQEREVDEKEMVRLAQLGGSSDERFKEAKRIEREALEFLRAAKEDPSLFFKTLGMDEESYFEQKRKQKELLASLTDEQREILRLRQEKIELERERKARLEEDENRKKSAIVEEAKARVDQDISNAFKQAGISAPTPRLLRRVAETMYSYLDATGKSLPALQALQHVMREDEEDRLKSFDTDDVSKILPKLPKKFLDALRKADIESLRSSSFKTSPKLNKDEPVKLEKKKFKSTDDIFSELESKLRKK